ncbi:carboxypeptidase-like regulatory domain-containing protein [Colwelliaceae bacterium MEBiC 14330]
MADEPDYQLYNWPIIEDNFVIINVRLNGRSVISDLSGYYSEEKKLLLPISPLNAALGIELNIENKILKGHIAKSNLSFTSVMQSTPYKSGEELLWAEDDFDYYLDLDVLNSVLNLKATFNYALMQLTITTNLLESDIPKEAIKTVKRKQKTSPVFDREIADQFQHITYPVSDYAISSSYYSKQEQLKNKLTLNSYFDAFKHKAEYRLNHNDTITNQFIKISKSLENPNQEGILSELHYELGDIQSQRDPLIMNFSQGRGVQLSNINSKTSQSFSNITIEEASLPGWFAELYRNGQFVASTDSTDENIVRFENVETFYGNNVFEIRLYGPEGEQVTRTKKISVGDSALSTGQLGYQFEVLDSTRNVLNTQFNNATNFRKSVSANISYGLSDILTYDIGLNHLTGKQDRQYISTALQSNSEFGSFKLAGAKQLALGSAFFAGYRGETSYFSEQSVSINLEYSLINNFNSAVFLAQKYPLKSRGLISLSSRLSRFNNINWNFKFSNEQRAQQQARQISQIGFNSSYLGGNWSTRFQYDSLQNELINQSYWAMDINAWRWTNSVDWKPLTSKALVRYKASLRWPQSKTSFNQTRLTYEPNALAEFVLEHQYSYRGAFANVNLSGQVDSENEWQITLGFSGTLSFDSFNNHVNFLPPRSLNSGQLAVASFLDTNKNGLFDTDEEPITDIGFNGNYLWKKLRTNSQGKVMLPSNGSGQILSIDMKTLSNPYHHPVDKKVKTISHRGGETKVMLPIEVKNEVEGTLYFTIDNKSKPASNVTVLLIDQQGKIKYQTTSEYDGYYFFPKVSAGLYSLELQQNQINESKLLTLNVPDKILAPEYGDTIILRDIILKEKSTLSVAQTKED